MKIQSKLLIVCLLMLIFSSTASATTTTISDSSIVTDLLDIYYGAVQIASVVDGYGCDASYCIYQPWYAPGQIYAKNGSTGIVDYSGTNVLTIFNNVRGNNRTIFILNTGEIYQFTNVYNIDGYNNYHLIGIGTPILNFITAPASTNSIFFQTSDNQNIKIQGLSIINSKKTAIIGKGTNIEIKNNIITNSSLQGINIQGNSVFVMENNISDIISEFGIVLGGKTNGAQIVNNFVSDVSSTKGCIQWGYSGENVLISNNILNNCGNGIEIGGTAATVNYTKKGIISNNIINKTGTGIIISKKSIAPADHVVSDFSIYNNDIYHLTGRGIDIRNTTNVTVSGNNIHCCGTYGIYLEGTVSGFIENNKIYDVSTHGIGTSSDNITYSNNIVNSSVFDGISFPSANTYSNTFVKGNIFLNFGRDAIRNPSSNTIITPDNYGYSGFAWGRKSSYPTAFGAGDTYFNTSANRPCYNNGTTWNTYANAAGC